MELSRIRLLYKEISHKQRLQRRRHPMFEKNKVMKIFGYFFIAFWAAYLIMLGFGVYAACEETATAYEPFDWIDGVAIGFLSFDFLTRFGMQETPAQSVKQYKLLPIPMRFLLHAFTVRMGFQPYNLFWFFFFVPFGIQAIPQFYGVWGLIGFLLGWWLLYVLNSYWYLLWRTLINRNMLYVFCPLILMAALIYFGFFFDMDNQWAFKGSMLFMRGFCQWNPLNFVIVVAVAIPLYIVNYRMQKEAVYAEIAKSEKIKIFKTHNMTFLDKFGVIGEYLKLEIKSVWRNLVVRKQFITGTCAMLVLCSLFSFTDVYDEMPFMRVFVCVYCFTCLSVMTLTTIMCAEGNYIDGLMVRMETVLSLLKAKYYFQCTMLLIPLAFSIMPIYEGKITALTAFGCLFFSSGVVFPFLFQLAVYNDSTIHLNEKITRSGRDSKMQMLIAMAALFLPMLVMYALVELFDNQIASTAMIVIGVAGTATHPLWLRNIYQRFMKRRYANMEGFRNSR